jgi:hypothetical protein
MDSIDFGCHQSFFEKVAARKSGSKIAKKQNQHKIVRAGVTKKQ